MSQYRPHFFDSRYLHLSLLCVVCHRPSVQPWLVVGRDSVDRQDLQARAAEARVELQRPVDRLHTKQPN